MTVHQLKGHRWVVCLEVLELVAVGGRIFHAAIAAIPGYSPSRLLDLGGLLRWSTRVIWLALGDIGALVVKH